jgi:hypothetical protein
MFGGMDDFFIHPFFHGGYIMRGVNYRFLISNWDQIVEKLCDEVTPHDILGIIQRHLVKTAEFSEKLSYKSDNLREAIQKIQEAMQLINPEG